MGPTALNSAGLIKTLNPVLSNFIKKINLCDFYGGIFIKKLFLVIIKFYQIFISPLKKPCCKFYPTCSNYAYEAYSKYGFFKASYLSIWRILRCNPFSKGGYDPVP